MIADSLLSPPLYGSEGVAAGAVGSEDAVELKRLGVEAKRGCELLKVEVAVRVSLGSLKPLPILEPLLR